MYQLIIMSVLIKILKIGLEQRPLKNIVFAAYTDNQQLISEELPSSLSPNFSFNFLVSKSVKIVTLCIQQVILPEKYSTIGKADLFLYNLEEIRPGQKTFRLLNFKKVIQNNKNINCDLSMLAGTCRIEVSYSLKRKILSQIEKVHIHDDNGINLVNQRQQPQKTVVVQKKYQQISMSSIHKEKPGSIIKELTLSNIGNRQQTDYEVDQQGYISMKPNNQDLLGEQILKELRDEVLTNLNQQGKMKLSVEEIKQFSSLDPSRLKQSAVVKHYKMHQGIKKAQIFQRLSLVDRTHIAVNKASDVFEVYNICCGQQIDRSHQIQEFY